MINATRMSYAYKEIYEILKIFPEDFVSKIPQEKIDFFATNMCSEYEFNVTAQGFDPDDILVETAAIITLLFRDYWATQEQKEKIINFQKGAHKIATATKESGYTFDGSGFRKNEDTNVPEIENKEKINNDVYENQSIAEIKDNGWKSIFNKIISFFRIKK